MAKKCPKKSEKNCKKKLAQVWPGWHSPQPDSSSWLCGWRLCSKGLSLLFIFFCLCEPLESITKVKSFWLCGWFSHSNHKFSVNNGFSQTQHSTQAIFSYQKMITISNQIWVGFDWIFKWPLLVIVVHIFQSFFSYNHSATQSWKCSWQHSTGWFFFTLPPQFQYQKENRQSANHSWCSSNFC